LRTSRFQIIQFPNLSNISNDILYNYAPHFLTVDLWSVQ